MAIHRVTAEWSGFTGAPGYTSFHFSPFTGGGAPDTALASVRAFFEEVRLHLALGTNITIRPTIEVIDEATGQLTGYLDGAAPAVVQSTGTGATYAGPTGAVINWLTNTVRDGRRVRGRTFLVPLRTAAFDSDGSLSPTALASFRTAANGLVNSANFDQGLVVWGRPGTTPGVAAPVVGARVPDMAAVLKSRRD